MKNIKYREKGNICIVTISRPEKLNCINIETLGELNDITNKIKGRSSIHCVIITGEGEKSFVAGAEVSEMKDMDVFEARKYSILGCNVLNNIGLLEKPTIAAINGYALGGGLELALSCDIRIASANAKLGLPEVTLGIIPGWGSIQKLARLIGPGRAKELIYTGKIICTDEALSMGLVNMVVEKGKLIESAEKLADTISGNSQEALSYAKAAADYGIGLDIEKASSFESEVFSQCFAAKDQKVRMQAFLDGKLKKNKKGY